MLVEFNSLVKCSPFDAPAQTEEWPVVVITVDRWRESKVWGIDVCTFFSWPDRHFL